MLYYCLMQLKKHQHLSLLTQVYGGVDLNMLSELIGFVALNLGI